MARAWVCLRAVRFILWRRLGQCCNFWARVEVFGVHGHFVHRSGWDSLPSNSCLLLLTVVPPAMKEERGQF